MAFIRRESPGKYTKNNCENLRGVPQMLHK